jgi:hypothetical protein
MDSEEVDLKKVGIIAGGALAATTLGYGAYYVFWRCKAALNRSAYPSYMFL